METQSDSAARTSIQELLTSSGNTLTSDAFAQLLDAQDPLNGFREQFHIPRLPAHSPPQDDTPGTECVYLAGNSLGLQPKQTQERLLEELQSWRERGVEGHFTGLRPWAHTDTYVLRQSEHVVGAREGEVSVMNSLSVNLHLMMVPFYRPTKERHIILVERDPFPSDLYAVQSQARFHGYDSSTSVLQVGPRAGEHIIRTEDILALLEERGQEIALVMLPGVQYYTGQWLEMQKITAAAHKQGCVVGWDLAHAVGNVPLQLHDWSVDFAVWCSYKYLNSGPGGIAGCFVHERHSKNPELHRFAGWWGHEFSTRFDMRQPFQPIAGAAGFRLSNPPVLCVASLLASLELFESASMPRLRAKSLLLTGYLEMLLEAEVEREHVQIITPLEPSQRGCQLSLLLPAGISHVMTCLHRDGIVIDERKPNVLRAAPTPLYNSFADVLRFVRALKAALLEARQRTAVA